MSIELKIKSKHLALEPAIIRKEENKLRKRINSYRQYYQVTVVSWDIYTEHPDLYKLYNKEFSLRNHRMKDVRNESRATYLARAYIKGVPYKAVEAKYKDERVFRHNILPRVFEMVAKYGDKPILKYWNGKRSDYREEEKEELMTAIRKWCELD